MKNKKIIYIVILFVFFIIVGTLSVNASQEINTIEDMVFILGNENIEVNENEIKLLNDIKLRDVLVIKSGNYIIDMNGKSISYTKNSNNTPLNIVGGSLIIKDDTKNGEIISKYSSISCYNGFLKIENCKVSSAIYVANEGKVQIDNGEFSGTVVISAGTLIINGGLFKNGVEVNFEEFTYKQPTLIINDGEFYGVHAGLYIWSSHYAKNIKLKGGTFKGIDEETPGIYVGGDKFELKKLLAFGHKFDNNEQDVEEISYDAGKTINYHTTSANEVSVTRRINTNIIRLIYLDYDNNIIKTQNTVECKIFTLPEAPEKEGYVFVGWDIEPENVVNDMIVTPIYEKIYNLEVDAIYPEYYTGEEIKPNISIIDEITKERLSEEDYEIICENNINVGTVNVVVQGKEKYKYSNVTTEFEILPKNIYYDYELKCEKDFEYTGQEIKPNVDFICGNRTLINGVDYEVYYESNVDVGCGRIIVSGIGNYTGEKTEIFRINKKQIDKITLPNETSFVYTGNEICPKPIVKAGNKDLIKDVDYTVYYSNNINIGTATIRISGTGNYTGGATIEFNIVSKDINNMNVDIDLSNKQYTGSSIKPTVKITDNNYVLRENFDYTVQYSNNSKIGKATIKIIGNNGYSGTIVETFEIVPKTVKIKSIKAPIIRTVKLTWQKDSSIDGYEIYRSNSKEGNYSLVKTINKNSKDNYLFLAHKKGTFYYTIKSYKIVDGNKIYSDFSNVKEIKVK